MNYNDENHDSNIQVSILEPIDQAVTDALRGKRSSLLRKLEEIEASISKITEEYSSKLRKLQEQKKPLEEALFHVEALLKIDGHKCDRTPSIGVPDDKKIIQPNSSLTDAAFSLLQNTHRPVHYNEITRQLQERNIYIPGKKPAATLLSRISRDSRFKRAKSRGMYGLSNWRIRATGKRKRKRHVKK